MRISREQARKVVDAAQRHAESLEIAVTVAVVDEGGLVKAIDRMDGAPPLSAQIAEAKAQGAAVWHRDGHALAEVAQDRPAFVTAVSQMTRLPLIAGAGSIVIRDGEGYVIGAVGVRGGPPRPRRLSGLERGRELRADTRSAPPRALVELSPRSGSWTVMLLELVY